MRLATLPGIVALAIALVLGAACDDGYGNDDDPTPTPAPSTTTPARASTEDATTASLLDGNACPGEPYPDGVIALVAPREETFDNGDGAPQFMCTFSDDPPQRITYVVYEDGTDATTEEDGQRARAESSGRTPVPTTFDDIEGFCVDSMDPNGVLDVACVAGHEDVLLFSASGTGADDRAIATALLTSALNHLRGLQSGAQ